MYSKGEKMQKIKLILKQYETYFGEITGLTNEEEIIITLSDEDLIKLKGMLKESSDFYLDFEKLPLDK